jgi:DNA-binding NtrC family response regulator
VRECRDGRFRSDLYYRISGLTVRIPPLRQRRSEIEPLARHFLSQFCRNIEQPEPILTAEALAVLFEYDWPGNVRELKNVVERSALLSGREPIQPEHVLLDPPPSEQHDSEPDALTEVIDRTSLRSPRDSLGAGRGSLSAARDSRDGRDSLSAGRDGRDGPSAGRHAMSPGRASLSAGRDSLSAARDSLSVGRETPSTGRRSLEPGTPSRAPHAEPASSGTSRIPKSLSASLLDPQGRAAQLDAERARLIEALDECGGNQTRAALRLGISRRQLISLIEFWQLPRPKKR